jgi:hypothetical protein
MLSFLAWAHAFEYSTSREEFEGSSSCIIIALFFFTYLDSCPPLLVLALVVACGGQALDAWSC